MRALAAAVVALVLATGAAASSRPPVRIVFFQGSKVVVVDPASGSRRVALAHAGLAALGWSGDGRLLSVGGRIVGGPRLPAASLLWAPTGETAAYLAGSSGGAVDLWSPGRGTRTLLPAAWGATSIAWGAGDTLAIGRSQCHAPCAKPAHQEVWLWRAGSLRRVAGPLPGIQRPIVAGVDGRGRALWWPDPQGSASIAADGLELHANKTPVAATLAYSDYVAVCGTHLALAAGGDRSSDDGKRIVFDGRDVSRDRTRSWVSPSCSADGSVLVAAVGPNHGPCCRGPIREHRAIWELLPRREQLTHPPAAWSDEDPRVLPDGSVLFVRTRETSVKQPQNWLVTDRGELELIADGRVSRLGETWWRAEEIGSDDPFLSYYGHFEWPALVAVSP